MQKTGKQKILSKLAIDFCPDSLFKKGKYFIMKKSDYKIRSNCEKGKEVMDMQEIISTLMMNEWIFAAALGGLLFIVQLLTFLMIRMQKKALEKQLHETDMQLKQIKEQQMKMTGELESLNGMKPKQEIGNPQQKTDDKSENAEQERPEQLIEAVLSEVFQN